MKLLYHPEARAEEREAAAWYREESTAVARRFRTDIRDVVLRARSAPRQFPRIAIGVRRALASTFPYIVYFIELPDGIYIVAISHTSRHPEYWFDRLT